MIKFFKKMEVFEKIPNVIKNVKKMNNKKGNKNNMHS
jgi:hypothetical protein